MKVGQFLYKCVKYGVSGKLKRREPFKHLAYCQKIDGELRS